MARTPSPSPSIGAHYEVGRLAALLDMSPRWVKERIKAGEMDGYRLGHKIVVPHDSLTKFLANRSMVMRSKEELAA